MGKPHEDHEHTKHQHCDPSAPRTRWEEETGAPGSSQASHSGITMENNKKTISNKGADEDQHPRLSPELHAQATACTLKRSCTPTYPQPPSTHKSVMMI